MVVDNIINLQEVKVYSRNRELVKTVSMPEQISGYEYEVMEAIECIRKGEKECPSMRHEDTLEVMRIMDEFRKEWGVRYPDDVEGL